MVLALFGISILFLVLLVILTYKKYFTVAMMWLYSLFGITAIISLGYSLVMLPEIIPVNERVIDEKIAMYQEENSRIEESIEAIVSEYMEYESETFESVASTASPIAYVSLFPELKSDELVKNQIDVYYANAEAIKTLKVEKIEISELRWILYFGH